MAFCVYPCYTGRTMRRFDLTFLALLVPLDALCVFGAACAAYALRFAETFTSLRPVVFSLPFSTFVPLALLYAGVTVAVFAFSGVYAAAPHRGLLTEIRRVVIATAASMAIILSLAFFSRTLFDSRFILLAAFLLSLFFLISGRLLLRYIQVALRTFFAIGCTRVAVVGDGSVSRTLQEYFAQHPGLGFTVLLHEPSFVEKVFLHEVKTRGLDVLLFAKEHASREEILAAKFFADTEHVAFFYSADLFEGSTLRPIVHTFAGLPVIEVPKTPLDGWGAILKRIVDIFGALFFIALTLPIQVLAAIALFVEQPGTVLFSRLPDGKRSVRIGQHGRPFVYFKFRSMIKDAHKYRFDPEFLATYGNAREGTPLFKLSRDPRVTRVGRILRIFSIDELPEFYLVLAGRMSLVGPRPHLPEEVAQYTPEQRRVLTIKPGVTGLSQISGRASLDFSDEVRLDMHYIENWSLLGDIAIILKTPFIILRRKGVLE